MKLAAINAGYFKLDGGAMFGVVPKSLWQKANLPDAPPSYFIFRLNVGF